MKIKVTSVYVFLALALTLGMIPTPAMRGAGDASTPGRILADDFVLVIGSGKTYTKTDMIKDAQSGDTSYERNDEDVQTVRVWGDTAVVTAKLWEKGTDRQEVV